MKLRGFVVGLIVGVAATGGGIALASIPSSSTAVFHACLTTKSGAIRLIDVEAGAKCSRSERLVSWNQAGQQGPVGLTGPAGSQGPAGTPGPVGPQGP